MRLLPLVCLSAPSARIDSYVTLSPSLTAPRHGSSSGQKKLPDFGIFHIINSGDRNEGKLLAASPMVSSYGTGSSAAGDVSEGHPRWTHGGDLFQDPLRYDSDDGTGPSPRQFPDSFNSDASSSAAGTSFDRRVALTSSFVRGDSR